MSPVPVLLCQAGPHVPRQLKRVMVPLGGTADSREALPLAVDIATRSRATVILCRVTPSPNPASSHERPAEEAPSLPDATAQRVTLDYLRAQAEHLRSLGVWVRAVSGTGDPARQIAALATQNHIDIAVMSTYARRGLDRYSLGSVPKELLECLGGLCCWSPNPVLEVVRSEVGAAIKTFLADPPRIDSRKSREGGNLQSLPQRSREAALADRELGREFRIHGPDGRNAECEDRAEGWGASSGMQLLAAVIERQPLCSTESSSRLTAPHFWSSLRGGWR
jgi:nucleotide-binding universal stress UspA family protein